MGLKIKLFTNSILTIIVLSIILSIFAVPKISATSNGYYVNVNYIYSNGIGTADDPFKNIQHAINVANSGDSIYVFGGTYNETLIVNKNVTIIGSIDNGNTIINRKATNRYTIQITADYVTIEGLNITDTDNHNDVAQVYITSNDVVLQGNNITYSDSYAIYFDNSNDNTIGNNQINGTKGIYLYSSNNNVFSNNIISYCSEAGLLLYSNSDNCIIYDNSFNNDKFGINSQYNDNLNISKNTILDSTIDGIKLLGGNNNKIKNNTLNNNANGLFISSTDSIINYNKFLNNQISINMEGSDCKISDNYLNNSDVWGLYASTYSSGNIIYRNYFNSNNENAKEEGNNQWYFEMQGNYWDDYNEIDGDLDKIGDTPYLIMGGAKDLYPLGIFLKAPDKPTIPSPTDGADGVGLSVTLSVKVTDPNNDALDVFFYRASDDKLYGLDYDVASGGTATCSFTLPFETTFLWYAIADDGKLQNRSDIWIFTTRQIPPLNLKPTADPGGPYTGIIGQAITLDGSESNDSDGNIDFYRWNFGDGSSEILETMPSHMYDTPGIYTVTLTVVDNDGRSSTSTTTATISSGELSNKEPVAVIGGPYTVSVGQSISFDGSSSYDEDGTIANYTWNFGDGTISNNILTSHEFNKKGTYSVTLMVVDDDGETDIATTTVTVKEEQKGIPGFELIVLIISCGLFLFWKKFKK